MNYYDNIRLKNGLLYARRPAYQMLTNLSTDDGYQDDRYHIVVQVDGVDIPVLRDLLWTGDSTYTGLTNDGDLFSFKLAKLYRFSSPIISAYVMGKTNHLMILLMNGTLAVLDDKYEIVTSFGEEVVALSSLYNGINSSNKEMSMKQLDRWLAITDSNKYLIISYKDGTFNIIDEIKVEQLHHSNIRSVKNGVIVSNDSSIRLVMDSKLVHYPHDIKGVIYALPRLKEDRVSIIILTKTGSLYMICDNVIHLVDWSRILLTRIESPGSLSYSYVYYQNIRGVEYRVPA